MIITTKRGSVGKPKISIKAETGFTNFTKVPEMLSGVDYMMLYNESRRNSGLSEVYSREQILKPRADWILTYIRMWIGSIRFIRMFHLYLMST